jgi:hypothetical protein
MFPTENKQLIKMGAVYITGTKNWARHNLADTCFRNIASGENRFSTACETSLQGETGFPSICIASRISTFMHNKYFDMKNGSALSLTKPYVNAYSDCFFSFS